MNQIIESVPGHTLGDYELAGRAVDVLKKHYPGYVWRVFLDDDHTGGVMHIMNETVNSVVWSNAPYGFTLKLQRVYQDPDLKCVMRAGGEILERARLARGWNQGERPKHIEGVADKHQPIILSAA